MGRPPCCDKVGMKKGPWTPDEDILLVSYVQENGPGNWKSVTTQTGLRRCSKSCRLRWTNYLRPGIRRGSFTDQEEKMIIQLQALLGNKWAAIASYLPERTDNDIKNYWNTHLKKKLKKLQLGCAVQPPSLSNDGISSNSHSISRGQWERRLQADINTAKQALEDALSLENRSQPPELQPAPIDVKPFSYASSTENIARLLKGWMKVEPKSEESKSCSSPDQYSSSNAVTGESTFSTDGTPSNPGNEDKSGIDLSSEAFESLFSFESFEYSSNSDFSRSDDSPEASFVHDEHKPDPAELAPMSMLQHLMMDDQGKDFLTNFSFDEHPELF